jgi:hypothetical protein
LPPVSEVSRILTLPPLAFVVRADDGTVEDEVEGEGKPAETETPKETKDDDGYPQKIGPSPDAQASIYFVDPADHQGI